MNLKDILSVGLTAEDFDTLIKGLNAIPSQGLANELTWFITSMSCAPESRINEVKESAVKSLEKWHKTASSMEEDLVVLKGKLILLKRHLLTKDAVQMANDILNTSASQ